MDKRDRRVVIWMHPSHCALLECACRSAYCVWTVKYFHVITKQVRVEFGSWGAASWVTVGTSGWWPRPIEAAHRWIKHRVNRCRSPAEALNVPHSDRASRATGTTIWHQASGHLSIWHLLLLPPLTGASQGHGARARTGWCHWWWVVGCGRWWCRPASST